MIPIRKAEPGRWLALALAACAAGAHAETALDAFDPATNGTVSAVLALPDGKVLLGGTFTSVGGAARSNLARVNADGTPDASFTADANGTVMALLRQPDGKILVGGFFGAIDGATRLHIARLEADGSLDAGFDAAATGNGSDQAVLGIARQADGKILIAGQFSEVGGEAHPGVARLDANGTVDPGFAANVSGSVSVVVAVPDGHVVIGGNFFAVDGQSRSYIARLNPDGTYDPVFSAFADAGVSAIVREPDGHFLVGGSFGSPYLKMARFDANGAVDSAFNLHIAGSRVSAIARQSDGSLLIGGSFQFVGSTPRKNLARFDSALALDASFDFDVEGGGFAPVSAIALAADGIAILGGELTRVDGQDRGHGARLRDDRIFVDGFE
jgi:uncharacterized delta-60 repeat protein